MNGLDPGVATHQASLTTTVAKARNPMEGNNQPYQLSQSNKTIGTIQTKSAASRGELNEFVNRVHIFLTLHDSSCMCTAVHVI